eukprot:24094_1
MASKMRFAVSIKQFTLKQFHSNSLRITTMCLKRFDSNSTIIPNYNPLVICGPSGIGKGTIVNYILQNYSNSFGHSISHTTREPRKDETDDIHYKFVNKQIFEEGIKNNEYIEYACTHGNYYGTHKQTLDTVKDEGKICILEIDVKGAKQVKEYHNYLDCNFIFITTQSPLITSQERLLKRGTESHDQIKTRLNTAKIELDFLDENPDFFHSVLFNEDWNECIDDVRMTLNQWYPWLNL